jgi:uncharacterized protein
MRHLPIVLALACATPALAEPTTLSLVTTANVSATPDVADIGTGVVTQAKEATAALSANATRMTAVVAALKKAGVADRDIQTSGLNLQPQYRYAENQPPVLTGYQVTNRVTVAMRDLKNTGRVIDTLVAQGANTIDGPTFRVSNPEPLLDKARSAAVAQLRARATLYATAAGLRVTGITAISEAGANPPPRPMPMMAMMARKESADSPVEAGNIDLGITLQMSFALEP